MFGIRSPLRALGNAAHYAFLHSPLHTTAAEHFQNQLRQAGKGWPYTVQGLTPQQRLQVFRAAHLARQQRPAGLGAFSPRSLAGGLGQAGLGLAAPFTGAGGRIVHGRPPTPAQLAGILSLAAPTKGGWGFAPGARVVHPSGLQGTVVGRSVPAFHGIPRLPGATMRQRINWDAPGPARMTPLPGVRPLR